MCQAVVLTGRARRGMLPVVMLRWVLGVLLLVLGGMPVVIALYGIGTRPTGDPASGYFVVASIGLPALLVGTYLVVTAIRAEGRAARK